MEEQPELFPKSEIKKIIKEPVKTDEDDNLCPDCGIHEIDCDVCGKCQFSCTCIYG